jgi:hypothetical protein
MLLAGMLAQDQSTVNSRERMLAGRQDEGGK